MIETVSNRILYIVLIVGSIAWCAAAKAEDPNELIWEALEYIKESFDINNCNKLLNQ